MTVKNILLALAAALGCAACQSSAPEGADAPGAESFVRVDGENLIAPGGDTLFIRGTNLGNWLNPEGYMFGFGRVNAPRQINDVFCEIAGPAFTAEFWKGFKDNYITRADIDFIASTGANTIRAPFHYKLFTDEDYMGLTSAQDGFARLDSIVAWSKANGLYVILDMHDAPSGQTGDNIDDSYGYPWLFEEPAAQEQFLEIWKKIAEHYRNEPTVLGYELINEPIATYFENQDELNSRLQPLYKRAVAAIREVDPHHIILIGAPQWNSNFEPLTETDYDPQLMFTCHRYGGPATADAIRSYIDFRDKSGKPMLMGELGHNTDQWQADFVKVLEENNIGYTFWPYKKIDSSCMVGFGAPEGWRQVIDYAEGPHATFHEIREHMIDHSAARAALTALLDSVRFEHCHPQTLYIESIGLKAE